MDNDHWQVVGKGDGVLAQVGDQVEHCLVGLSEDVLQTSPVEDEVVEVTGDQRPVEDLVSVRPAPVDLADGGRVEELHHSAAIQKAVHPTEQKGARQEDVDAELEEGAEQRLPVLEPLPVGVKVEKVPSTEAVGDEAVDGKVEGHIGVAVPAAAGERVRMQLKAEVAEKIDDAP